jgi:RimJ/RimL family protein N-acetyltransferase
LIDPDNSASENVAKKLGMTFEKTAHDDLGDFSIYSISK